ncbi:response regulator [Dissulfurirhabdus thermomarina]|nr:response regulator [Dissulfurirhabdus thermomarina]
MRKRIGQAVERAGHEVVGLARDGQEGVDLYRRLRPDCVVMDVTMQGMDGLSAARIIREEDRGARIVFMSLLKDDNVVGEALSLGAEAFLGKDEYDRLLEILGGSG